MAHIVIVEDESIYSNELKRIIKKIDKESDIYITAYAREAFEHASAIPVDLFLLDIQLKDYSGIKLAKKLREMEPYILTPMIFITAVPTKELVAFKELHCYDYILKPFCEEDVEKAIRTILDYGIYDDHNQMIQISQKHFLLNLRVNDIIYAESEKRRVKLCTKKETLQLASYTLQKLHKQLPDTFIRCHRSFIINKAHIEKIDKSKQEIHLRRVKTPIPIGKSYKIEDLI